ncbi:MAG: thiamine pyrophosphate-dependent enzyme [Cyanobacteria bacterium P01_A01_bin.123]
MTAPPRSPQPSPPHPSSTPYPVHLQMPPLPHSPTPPLPPSPHGLIIAGPAEPTHPLHYCQAIAHLCQALGWPVLAEGLSPLRNYAALNPYLISTYDGILRNDDAAAQLKPEQVLQLGPLPTSKVLRQWLARVNPLRWVVDGGDRNLDTLHGSTMPITCAVEDFAAQFPQRNAETTPYARLWRSFDHQFRHQLDQRFQALSLPIESKLAWLLSRHLPENTPLLIANSMPVRDVEWFWQPNDRHIRPYFNRGANGIDGTLSTALGIAQHHKQAVLLTGDLALLHDTNGFLARSQLQGHLTIIVINNNGGGIFEMLPIAQFEPPFETFFATPQNIDFAALCHTYGVEHRLIKTWEQCVDWLNPLPQTGIRLLELQTNRKTDAQWRQDILQAIADGLVFDLV